MRRRQFLQLTSGATLYLTLPRGDALAAWNDGCAAPVDGPPILITFEAYGGWDPQMFCDPVVGGGQAALYSPYGSGDYLNNGVLTYAPFKVAGGPIPYTVGTNNEDFFEKYKNDLLIVNGVDTQTNSHDVGPRTTWSGVGRPGYPTLAALVAAAQEEQAVDGAMFPLSFISTGGYDNAAGLLPVARAGTPSLLIDLTHPHLSPFERTAVPHELIPPDAIESLKAYQAGRLERQLTPTDIPPRRRFALNRLHEARQAEELLGTLGPVLENKVIPDPSHHSSHELVHGMRIVLSAMLAGICRTAHLQTTGFDTHSQHDNEAESANISNLKGHRAHLKALFEAVDYTVGLLCQHGLWHRTTIVVGSDFGRTVYNGDNLVMRGKNHWPITSMMILGAGVQGGRVIGQTQAVAGMGGIQAKGLALSNGQLVPSDNGFLLRPAHIHDALRRHLGIHNTPLANRFPLGLVDEEQNLPLLKTSG